MIRLFIKYKQKEALNEAVVYTKITHLPIKFKFSTSGMNGMQVKEVKLTFSDTTQVRKHLAFILIEGRSES